MFTFLLSHNNQTILKYKVHWKRSYAYSTISRAILKPVYQFGIPNSDSQTLKSVKTNSTALVPKCALSVLFCFSYTQLKFASHKHFFLFHFAFVVHATHVSYTSLFALLCLHTSHKTISQ